MTFCTSLNKEVGEDISEKVTDHSGGLDEKPAFQISEWERISVHCTQQQQQKHFSSSPV